MGALKSSSPFMAVFFMPSTLRQQVEMMGIMIVIQNIMPIALAIFVSMT